MGQVVKVNFGRQYRPLTAAQLIAPAKLRQIIQSIRKVNKLIREHKI